MASGWLSENSQQEHGAYTNISTDLISRRPQNAIVLIAGLIAKEMANVHAIQDGELRIAGFAGVRSRGKNNEAYHQG